MTLAKNENKYTVTVLNFKLLEGQTELPGSEKIDYNVCGFSPNLSLKILDLAYLVDPLSHENHMEHSDFMDLLDLMNLILKLAKVR